MTPERLQRAREIFEEALECRPEERDDLLTRRCGEDGELRAQVEKLLCAHDQAEHFLETPPFIDPARMGETPEPVVGRRIGPYRILREIGQGGMSAVYLAVRADDEYEKQVAIKLVWPGLRGDELIRRFKRERQILADLEHPNIARLLDGGTTDEGWPYLVMEYIDGEPITFFCDQCKLTITERLKLFQTVCAAVEYAHQRRVIHRDLKPSNILVATDGVVKQPKLLDFGIAKLLGPEAASDASTQTLSALHLMTPDYASPEQVRGEQITAASDVYSLGVILYELLTGRRPYRVKGFLMHELARAICETEPELPSRAINRVIEHADGETARVTHSPEIVSRTREGSAEKLRRRLRGDLDNITLMALAKDPAQRYPSPAALAADIERHLRGQAVTARGDHLLYRAGKRLRRHKLVAVLLVLILVALPVITVWQIRARRESEEAQRRERYAEHIRRAAEAWEMGRPESVKDELKSALPRAGEEDLRGIEWYYLWQLQPSEQFTLRHNRPLGGADFTPDGRTVLTADFTHTAVSLWEAATGKLIATLTDAEPPILEQIFFVEGEVLRHKWSGRNFKVSDALSGAQLADCSDPAANFIELDGWPFGKRLMSVSDGAVKLWHWPDCRSRLLVKLPPAPYDDWQRSPDGRRLLVFRGAQMTLWDLTSGRLITDFTEEAPYSGRDISADGRMLFTLAGDRIVRLFDAENGRQVAIVREPRGIVFAFFSRDHRKLITIHEDGEVKVRDSATGAQLSAWKGHENTVQYAALAGENLLATVGADRTLRLWDLDEYRQVFRVPAHAGERLKITASRDGRQLVTTSSDGTAKLWRVADLMDEGALNGHTDKVFSVAFSPDGRRLATGSGDRTIKLWDAQTRQLIKTFTGHEGNVLCVAFSPDGQRLVSSGQDGTARVWDAETGQSLLTLRHPTQVHFVAVSPDGKLLATGCDDGNVRLWDAATGSELATLTGHRSEVWALGFSPDGRLLASGSTDRSVKLWDVTTRSEKATLVGHSNPVWSTVFSPDGRFLATGSGDRTVRLWDAQTHRLIRTFIGHTDEIFEVAFSPDGKRLATASNDSTIKIWDTATGQQLLTLKDHIDQVWSVAFSPDGRTLASGSWDKTARLWRTATEEEVKTRSGRD